MKPIPIKVTADSSKAEVKTQQATHQQMQQQQQSAQMQQQQQAAEMQQQTTQQRQQQTRVTGGVSVDVTPPSPGNAGNGLLMTAGAGSQTPVSPQTPNKVCFLIYILDFDLSEPFPIVRR